MYLLSLGSPIFDFVLCRHSSFNLKRSVLPECLISGLFGVPLQKYQCRYLKAEVCNNYKRGSLHNLTQSSTHIAWELWLTQVSTSAKINSVAKSIWSSSFSAVEILCLFSSIRISMASFKSLLKKIFFLSENIIYLQSVKTSRKTNSLAPFK